MVRTGNTFARSEAEALVDQQHCMYCHTAEPPYLAPSFPQIAKHYRRMPGTPSALEQKLSIEGPTHWGDITMPISDRVDSLSPEDAHTVARWMLNQ
ncbi:cytochrome C [Paraburkholderia sp. 1N]|uniref:Cytochrome C n=2 Tax=Paraburkholderia solitsugae TaxID=2675748 RepID=A0ABX2BG45_9BURK|nr:cytochrome C [Paraburkholderia solitsugae]